MHGMCSETRQINELRIGETSELIEAIEIELICCSFGYKNVWNW